MDNCNWMRQVGAYHDGELPGEERIAFEAHLAECAVCARELAQLRSLSHLLTGARVALMPEKTLQGLYEMPQAREHVLVRMGEALMAAAAIILVACAAWLLAGFGQGTAQATTSAPWVEAEVSLNTETTSSDTVDVAQRIVEDLSLENAHE